MVILIEAFLGIIVLLIILTSIVDIRFCYLEELEISGECALKTHKLICDLYDNGGMKK